MIVDPKEAPEFYHGYLNQLEEGSVLENLMVTGDNLSAFIQTIPENLGEHRYAADKWSIKEVLQHINDAERVFAYRVLRFARNDQSELLGFDQNAYVPESRANERKLASILNEFHILRAASIDLFSQLEETELNRVGVASGGEFTVRAIGYIISGHCKHHQTILNDRYLNDD